MIKIHWIQSDILKQERRIRVYLPNQTTGPYAVMYMHDGQNLFEKKYAYIGESWEVHKQVHRLIKAKMIPNLMIVAIDNNKHRLDEFSPFENDELHRLFGSKSKRTPYGEAYAAFIVEEVKPFIDQHYHTLPGFNHTLIAGSSMGGVISLYMGLKYPDVFGGVGILSAATWYNQSAVEQFLSSNQPNPNQRFFIAVGSNEYDDPVHSLNEHYIKCSEQIYGHLHHQVHEIYFKVYQGAIHTEAFWAVLVNPMVLYFFGHQI